MAVASSHVFAGVLAAGAVVGRLLMTGNPFDHLWAEDGKVFLAGGVHPGSFLHSYAGYGHFVPRLLAAIGAQLPVRGWAAFAVVAAAATVGVLAGFVRWAAEVVSGSAVTGWIAAAALALTPALGHEALGSMANLQWFMLAAALWAFLLPRGRGRWATVLLVGLTAATTPLVVLLLPAAVLVHRTQVWRAPAIWGMAAGLAYQVVVIRFGAVDAGGPHRAHGLTWDMIRRALATVAGGNVAGPRLAKVVVLAVIVLFVLGIWRAKGLRVPIIASAVSAAGFLLTVTWFNGAAESRYTAAACMLAAAGIALVVGACGPVAVAAFTVVGLAAFVALPAAPYKFQGPGWSANVATWQHACQTTGEATGQIALDPPGWGTAAVHCP